MPGEERSSSGILFFKEIVQSFQRIFPVNGGGRCLFPEYKIVAEVGPVARSLELCLWLKTSVMRCLCIQSAVQADMKVAAALCTDGFSRKELVQFYFFFAMAAYLHQAPPALLEKADSLYASAYRVSIIY